MHYIDQFYSGLFPLTLHVFRNFKVPSSGVCLMLPDNHILKTNSQYVQKSVDSHKTTCKNIQNTLKSYDMYSYQL